MLGYVSNEVRRFHIFVANRAQFIRDNSDVEEWHYVKTNETPADDASRGLSPDDKLKLKRWFNGPEFLYDNKDSLPTQKISFALSPDDPEVKSKENTTVHSGGKSFVVVQDEANRSKDYVMEEDNSPTMIPQPPINLP